MPEKGLAETGFADSAAFNRRFKYALIAYAIVEFIVIALVVFYKVRR
jgi:large-conductance mechanosensitive channel